MQQQFLPVHRSPRKKNSRLATKATHPDQNTHAEMKPLKRTRAVIAGVILLRTLLMGGVTSDLLQATMRFTQIRIERATILVEPPYANLLPAPKDFPLENYEKKKIRR
jgi:hypothetical protein